MQEKMIGKIQSISFGLGGYDSAMLGISLTFGGPGWGVGDFKGAWAGPRNSDAKWTEQSRIEYLGKLALEVGGWLDDAKVNSLDKLKNVPVEVTFDGQVLKSWRILKEVL